MLPVNQDVIATRQVVGQQDQDVFPKIKQHALMVVVMKDVVDCIKQWREEKAIGFSSCLIQQSNGVSMQQQAVINARRDSIDGDSQ